tara:strand:+ start:314 stop:1078 length:765 start_codon:yes stop_codon:yes gene_type:complete
MIPYKQILEQRKKKGKAVVFTFGRFQPPTAGHELLIRTVQAVAKKENAEYRIYPSKSEDEKKNPLKHKEKVTFMKKFFKGANIVYDTRIGSPFHAAKALSDEGYKRVIMVVGGDRVQAFKRQISRYINHPDPDKSFNFDSFKVVSAGRRDPDASDISGMSASKMRAAASKGDFDAFSSGLPKGSRKADIKKMYDLLRKRMGISESYDGINNKAKKKKPIISFSKYKKKPLEDGTDEAREDRQRLTPGQPVVKYT